MNSISSAILYFSITLHIALNFERTCSDMSILWGKKQKCNSVTFKPAPFLKWGYLNNGIYHGI